MPLLGARNVLTRGFVRSDQSYDITGGRSALCAAHGIGASQRPEDRM